VTYNTKTKGHTPTFSNTGEKLHVAYNTKTKGHTPTFSNTGEKFSSLQHFIEIKDIPA
jgi:hypothetical protein